MSPSAQGLHGFQNSSSMLAGNLSSSRNHHPTTGIQSMSGINVMPAIPNPQLNTLVSSSSTMVSPQTSNPTESFPTVAISYLPNSSGQIQTQVADILPSSSAIVEGDANAFQPVNVSQQSHHPQYQQQHSSNIGTPVHSAESSKRPSLSLPLPLTSVNNAASFL